MSLVQKLSQLKVSSITYEQILSSQELSFMTEVISTQNFKENLKNVHLIISDLDDALRSLNVMAECKCLESVELGYKNSCIFDIISVPEDAIKVAEKKFYDKVGKIKKFRIYHK